ISAVLRPVPGESAASGRGQSAGAENHAWRKAMRRPLSAVVEPPVQSSGASAERVFEAMTARRKATGKAPERHHPQE
ncbi:MAG: hypothetical protein ICV82_09255, partial [Nitrososphaera sp.]|nr:hypothetical protein [Nitrososphaera sp.]